MATERVQVVVRLPVDVVARLRQERRETGRSLQAILEEAVRLREAVSTLHPKGSTITGLQVTSWRDSDA